MSWFWLQPRSVHSETLKALLAAARSRAVTFTFSAEGGGMVAAWTVAWAARMMERLNCILMSKTEIGGWYMFEGLVDGCGGWRATVVTDADNDLRWSGLRRELASPYMPFQPQTSHIILRIGSPILSQVDMKLADC